MLFTNLMSLVLAAGTAVQAFSEYDALVDAYERVLVARSDLIQLDRRQGEAKDCSLATIVQTPDNCQKLMDLLLEKADVPGDRVAFWSGGLTDKYAKIAAEKIPHQGHAFSSVEAARDLGLSKIDPKLAPTYGAILKTFYEKPLETADTYKAWMLFWEMFSRTWAKRFTGTKAYVLIPKGADIYYLSFFIRVEYPELVAKGAKAYVIEVTDKETGAQNAASSTPLDVAKIIAEGPAKAEAYNKKKAEEAAAANKKGKRSEQYHPRSEQPHPRSEQYHPRSEQPHPRSEQPHPRSEQYHPRSEQYHPRSEQPHPRSEQPHPRSEQPHPRSEQYHPRSEQYHPRSEQYHPRSEQYHPRSDQYHPRSEQYHPRSLEYEQWIYV